ncbi:hypothetical protein PG997_000259 [Apiospora hydei]|uniref:Uncharacterized protein n=1 Tax=Apiospora hydei TaxID=1337664 RepID=A0ABR1XAF3_9PEZI
MNDCSILARCSLPVRIYRPSQPARTTVETYLVFLVILKNLLPGKSIPIAAPSSYWYLKQYPIKGIAKVVDYIRPDPFVYLKRTLDTLHQAQKGRQDENQDGHPEGVPLEARGLRYGDPTG